MVNLIHSVRTHGLARGYFCRFRSQVANRWIPRWCEGKKSAELGHLNFVMKVALFFRAKVFAIRDKEMEAASVGYIDCGAESFVEDVTADGEPKSATGMVGGTDALLLGKRPGLLPPGAPKAAPRVGKFGALMT